MPKELSDMMRWIKEAGYNPLKVKSNITEALYERAVLRQVFINQEYRWLWEKIKDNTIVIDIGAFIGDSAIYFAMNPKVKMVHAYEPTPSSYEKIKKNITLSGFNNIKAYNAFVAGEREIKRIGADTVNNAAVGREGFSESSSGVEVPAHTLDDVLNQKRNIAIKCDAEGAEYEIFKEADLSNVYAMQLEFHRGGQELAAILKKKGFKSTFPKNQQIGIMCCYR